MSETLTARHLNSLRHDELNEHYHPIYFHEFARRAERHGLQYLGEAEWSEPGAEWLAPEELEMLAGFEGDPLLVREQYLDFLKCRHFRQTLLCRKERPLQRKPADDVILGLLVTSTLKPVSQTPDLDSATTETFKNLEGGSYSIGVPPAKRLLARLAERWPFPIRVAELVADDAPAPVVADFLLNLQYANLVDLRTHWVPYVHRPGERPVSSPLVRKQCVRQEFVTNNEHQTLRFEDERSRELVLRLDGTRTREDLLAELLKLAPEITRESLDTSLRTLGTLAVLTA